MGSLVVSASMGTINQVLGKLSRLITEEHAKLKDRERKEVIWLKEELGCMVPLFRGSAMAGDPDLQVKEWMRQVREVAYDTEDWVDLFLHAQLLRPREPNFLARLSPKARSRSKRLVEQIRQLRDRLVAASERRTRYKLVVDAGSTTGAASSSDDQVLIGSSSVAIDPRLLHREEAAPVAIDGPTSELVQRLVDDERHLRVVSIVGMAGIGKTTLAKQVYKSMLMRRRFHCQAFVYVGQSPSVRAVLLDILRQVSPQEQGHGSSSSSNILGEHQVMTLLRDFLHDKRYLIIFDDVWSMSAWKAINCALPGNCIGSRIITTTRNHDVAKSCSHHPDDDVIHVMEPLDESDSKRLFHSRVFGSEEDKCPDECTQVHSNVAKICGGLPWAILVVASLLARKYAEPGGWNMVNRSTLSALDQQYPPLLGMMKVLHMSYSDLPLPLKSCLLYLSVFPRNYTINKDRLIRRWVAEGFIPVKGEESTLETGRSYFNELINRSLIQPVLGDDDQEEPIGCTVHSAVHDFVASLCSEENFVTLDESMPRDVIRRLSLNYAKAKQEDDPPALASDSGSVKINLSQARSLTVFGSAQRMPHLANFLLLRVLDLEDAEGLESKSIDDIGRLFNLRYLGLGGDHITELPDSIGELRFLETLEVRRTSVRRLPPAAARLRKLVCLLAGLVDEIPDGIEKMQDLQELLTVNVNSHRSLGLVSSLTKLRQLRTLGLKWCFPDEQLTHVEIQACRSGFLSSLNKVASLESLFLHSGDACSLDFLADAWVPPRLLQKLVVKSMNYHFPTIPVHLASCPNLTYLEIAIDLDREEDLSIISDLPELTILKLCTKEKPVIIRQGFQCLRVFWLECRSDAGLELVFHGGAMPQLRKLHLSFNWLALQKQEGFDFGLRNLCALKQVHANINCYGGSASEVLDSLEVAIRGDLSVHPNKPAFELSKHNYVEEKGTTVEEQNKRTVQEVSN